MGKLKNIPNNGKNTDYKESNWHNLSFIKASIRHEPPTTPILTETTESTLSSETHPPTESISTPIFDNLQRLENENALLTEQIPEIAIETEAVKMFMKEQQHLLKKNQRDKSDEQEHRNKNAELVQLLRQGNRRLLEKNLFKMKPKRYYLGTWVLSIRIYVMQIPTKKKIYQIVEKKSVTKSNEKSRAKINCKNRNETLGCDWRYRQYKWYW